MNSIFTANGADEPVGQQNAQERADQRRADLLADLLDRPVDGAHRDHDPQHGRHDAETRQGVGHFGQHALRRVMLFGDQVQFRVRA